MTADLALIRTLDDWLDYMEGRSDCAKGIEKDETRSPSYQKGYAHEYELGEQQTAESLGEAPCTKLSTH